MEEFEPLPTIEEAAMMAAGIQPGDDSPGSEGLVILPHQLPRPVYTPPSPPPSVEPLYQPVDGKPVGENIIIHFLFLFCFVCFSSVNLCPSLPSAGFSLRILLQQEKGVTLQENILKDTS